MNRNILISLSISTSIVISFTIAIAISKGFGRSKVLMNIEAQEREESAEQAKAAKIPTRTVVKPSISNQIPPSPVNTAPTSAQNPIKNNPNINSGDQVIQKTAPLTAQNNTDNISPSNQEHISSSEELRQKRIEQINNREKRNAECNRAIDRYTEYIQNKDTPGFPKEYGKTLEDDVKIVCN